MTRCFRPHSLAELSRSLSAYPAPDPDNLARTLTARLEIEPFNAIATGIVLLAILYTLAAAPRGVPKRPA